MSRVRTCDLASDVPTFMFFSIFQEKRTIQNKVGAKRGQRHQRASKRKIYHTKINSHYALAVTHSTSRSDHMHSSIVNRKGYYGWVVALATRCINPSSGYKFCCFWNVFLPLLIPTDQMLRKRFLNASNMDWRLKSCLEAYKNLGFGENQSTLS